MNQTVSAKGFSEILLRYWHITTTVPRIIIHKIITYWSSTSVKRVEAELCQVGSCGREAKLQLTVELSKLMYLQLSQVKDVLREVIKSLNKPQYPVEKDWYERLNVKLMTVTRSVNQKSKMMNYNIVEDLIRSECSK